MDETNTGPTMAAPCGKGDPDEIPIADRRSDDVGRLAWQLLGPPDGVPDFSAVIPLLDALEAAGDMESRERLESAVHRFARRCRNARRPNGAKSQLSDFRGELSHSLPHLFVGLGVSLAAIDRVVKLAVKPAPEVEESKAEMTILWVEVDYPTSLGERVGLPDGRRGVVVRGEDSRGRVGVVLQEEGGGEAAGGEG